MTDLAEACAAIAALIPEARHLIHQPDEDGTTTHSQPASRPPWNQAAASAAMDAHEGLRRLEASLRLAVNGHPGTRRGGSTMNTFLAIEAIENLGNAVTTEAAARAARIIDRWSRNMQELAAIDTAEPWRPLPGAQCPYCKFAMLAAQRRSGYVACMRALKRLEDGRRLCADGDGYPPRGRIDSVTERVYWDDGLVT